MFGIYFFRTRSRRYDVSSLFLWVDHRQATQSGRKIQQLQLPFLIILEMLVLILLTIAASQPMFRTESIGNPTIIILDASYSMLAETNNSTTQQRAIRDLHRMFSAQIGSQSIGYPIQFILAGAKPQLLLNRAKNAVEARNVLESWSCGSPVAEIETAITLATNISTSGTKILVVTDHLPNNEIAEGRVLWKSYGNRSDNLAIIHASRVFQENKDRVLLEIANFSEKAQKLRLSITELPTQRRLFRQDDQILESGQTHLIRTVLPQNTGTIEVRLDKDSLTIDNHLVMLPSYRRPIRVGLDLLSEDIADKIKKAVEVSGIATIVSEHPEIVFRSGDSEQQSLAKPDWLVSILSESDSSKVKPFVGPFVLDRSHPLTVGLSLEGVVWAASDTASDTLSMRGRALISAGSVPLVTEQRQHNGSRVLTLQINNQFSTLTTEPAFPILIWNILKYRSYHTVGMAANNLKLGAEAEFVPAKEDKTIEIQPPHGQLQTIMVTSGNPIKIPTEETGIYRVKSVSGIYEFAVGTLSAEESNLLNLTTATKGNWLDEETLRTEFQPIAWLLLLSALIIVMIHHWFISVRNVQKS